MMDFLKRQIIDTLLGLIVSALIIYNGSAIASYLSRIVIKNYSIQYHETQISWLMGWPAGLKLNDQLDKFLGDLFLWIIGNYKLIILNYGESILYMSIIACTLCSFFSLSLLLAIWTDVILWIVSGHIQIMFIISTRIYYWKLRILFSLFNLFRGYKWNVLRNRMDSADYHPDQLLFGTVLFALVFFMIPTVTVYYILFTSSLILVKSIEWFAKLIIMILNEWPLNHLEFRGIILDYERNRIEYIERSFLESLKPALKSVYRELIKPLISWKNIKTIILGNKREFTLFKAEYKSIHIEKQFMDNINRLYH